MSDQCKTCNGLGIIGGERMIGNEYYADSEVCHGCSAYELAHEEIDGLDLEDALDVLLVKDDEAKK